eukprot:GHVQ01015085.1.p2 GENE.GHVQ01015085.1~~GHVQ01015085.1.p2  ORF type:complete len:454 (+),score=57.72 GHVQ01015085.1:2521-3882(+)
MCTTVWTALRGCAVHLLTGTQVYSERKMDTSSFPDLNHSSSDEPQAADSLTEGDFSPPYDINSPLGPVKRSPSPESSHLSTPESVPLTSPQSGLPPDLHRPPPLPKIEWYEGFRLPLGADGRQVLLRKLREIYHANAAEWDRTLVADDIVFSRMPYATVQDLYKVSNLFGVFGFALKCSAEYGGDPTSSRGPKKRRKSNSASAITLSELKKELDVKNQSSVVKASPVLLRDRATKPARHRTPTSSSGSHEPPVISASQPNCYQQTQQLPLPSRRKRGRPKSSSRHQASFSSFVKVKRIPLEDDDNAPPFPPHPSMSDSVSHQESFSSPVKTPESHLSLSPQLPQGMPIYLNGGLACGDMDPMQVTKNLGYAAPQPQLVPPNYNGFAAVTDSRAASSLSEQLDHLAFQYTLASQYLQILQLLSMHQSLLEQQQDSAGTIPWANTLQGSLMLHEE